MPWVTWTPRGSWNCHAEMPETRSHPGPMMLGCTSGGRVAARPGRQPKLESWSRLQEREPLAVSCGGTGEAGLVEFP